MDIVKKYPIFHQKIYSHPQGGVILPKSKLEELYNIYSVNAPCIGSDTSSIWGDLNEFGTELLLKCNGEKSIEDIAKKVYDEKSDEFKDSILRFFENIAAKYDVEFLDNPSFHRVETCGTSECYYPLRVLAEVTTRCNLKCQHCSASAGMNGKDMKNEDLFRIIDTLIDNGTRDFEISGGEPLLRRDIFDIVKKCCNAFCTVVFATNGMLIGKEEAKNLAEYGNLSVQVSLDSHTPEFHDHFRGVEGAFEKAVSGIYHCVSQGVHTRVEVTVSKDNVRTFEEILLFASELGVRGVNYDMVRDVGRGEGLSIAPEDIISWMKEVETIGRKYMEKYPPFYERNRREFISQDCGAGRTFWTLGSTGNVRPCNYLPENHVSCGNLLRDDFHSIFSSESALRLSQVKFPCKKLCGECKYLPYCDRCFCNGVVMYRKLKDVCTWGATMKIGDWLTVKSS